MSSQVATGVDALGARRSGARVLSATAFTGAVLAFALPFGTVANCDGVDAVRARRRAGRRVWGYAFGRCVLALWPTLALIVLIAIALAAGA